MSSAARVLPSGHLLGRFCKCRRRFNARGAGGGSSRRNKVKVSPFPPGRGGRGDRGKKSIIWQEKQARQDTAPRREPQRQVEPVPRGFSPGDARGGAPCMKITLVSPPFPPGRGGRGDRGKKSIIWQEKQASQDTAPRREPQRQVEPVPRGFSPGDARGGAPCMKITLVPPSRWEGGQGGWGQERKLKAGAAGDQNNRAPPQGTAAAGQAGDKEGKPHLRVPLTPRRAGAAQGHAPLPPTGHPLFFCHRPPPIKNSGKVLGGLGASFKKPPTLLFPPLPCPRRL